MRAHKKDSESFISTLAKASEENAQKPSTKTLLSAHHLKPLSSPRALSALKGEKFSNITLARRTHNCVNNHLYVNRESNAFKKIKTNNVNYLNCLEIDHCIVFNYLNCREIDHCIVLTVYLIRG